MALPDAITREELYMKYLTGDTSIELPLPITRKEIYLYYLCQNGTGGGTVTPEQIEAAVNKYLTENPVQAGATAEQAAQIEKNKSDIIDISGKFPVSEKNTTFFRKKGKNLLNPNDEKNKYGYSINSSGELFSNIYTKNSIVSDFIEIDNTIPVKTTTGYNSIICYFDESKEIIQYKNDFTNTNYIITPENAKYIRVSWYSDYESTFMIYQSNETLPYEPYSDDYEFVYSENAIHIYAEEGIDTFYDKMKKAFSDGGYNVYIHEGEYIYTDEFVHKLRDLNERGVPIGNGCKYYFDSGSKIICKYDGDRLSDVMEWFSPLDTASKNDGFAGSFELNGLNIDASGVLYGIHADPFDSKNAYSYVFNDCKVVLDNTGKTGGYNLALGGGLGDNAKIIVNNCYFNAVSNTLDGGFHGNENGDTAMIVITNSYFEHYCSFSGGNISDEKTVIFANNSQKTDQAIPDGWTFYKWNNEIRDESKNGAGVKDVKIDNESILRDGIANIPIMESGKYGLVRTNINFSGIGVIKDDSGKPCLINSKFDKSWIPNRFAYGQKTWAVRYDGIDDVVRACMSDGLGEEWTEGERVSALKRLGCTIDESGYVKFQSTID